VIELRLSADDLTQLRFSVSPLSEAMASVAVLYCPASHPQYRKWVAATRARIRHLDQELLLALVPPCCGPRVSLPLGDADTSTTVGHQLQAVADCPPELMRAELELLWSGRPMPGAARRVIAEGPAGMHRIADLLESYWELAIAPYWPGIRAVIEAEVARGARRVAEGGVRALLADLHPYCDVTDGAIRLFSPDLRWEVDAAGLSVRLIPSVFNWPHATVDTGMNGPPSLLYGPNQIGSLWDADRIAADYEPLKDLLGRSRAAILYSVGSAKSTTELARDLQHSPATISAHLSTLLRCGLVTSWRSGRYVLYQRTPLATTLITTVSEQLTQIR
jgi:DNA-binding MarR family transcriptional regulator